MNKHEYAKHLNTKAFNYVRELTDSSEKICWYCSRSRWQGAIFDTHHLSYKNTKGSIVAEAKDCRLACRDCHYKQHQKTKSMSDIENDLSKWL